MKTIPLNLYTFTELDTKAQSKACERWRENDLIDVEFTLDDARTVGRHLGFDIERIPYSGFHSQGDGASITGSWQADHVDPAHLKEHAPTDTDLAEICETLSAISIRNPEAHVRLDSQGHSCHEHSVSYSHDDISDADADLFEETARSFMLWIYDQLETEYEYQTSDETIGETLTANEYFFTQDGTVYHE